MWRTVFTLAVLFVGLALAEWLVQRPPRWLSADPLVHPFGHGLPPDSVQSDATPVVTFPIDPNRASHLELQALPGVGPVLARRIKESAAAEPFRHVRDLTRVRGIGPKTLIRIAELIHFAEPADSLTSR